jgi:hypothetical protein
MSLDIPPSDELLNALVDGELGPADAEPLLARLRADAALRERVGQLQLQKSLVRHAYAGLAPAAGVLPRVARQRRPAAALALALTGAALLGWAAHGWQIGGRGGGDDSDALSRLAAQAAHAPQGHVDHIVLHLSSGAAQDETAALDRAEGILGAARAAGRTVAVEIVANSGGLDLLREGVSADAPRIARLRGSYPGLALVACGQTAQRLREGGAVVRLLPGVTLASSALDQIVLRMQQGWAYVKI